MMKGIKNKLFKVLVFVMFVLFGITEVKAQVYYIISYPTKNAAGEITGIKYLARENGQESMSLVELPAFDSIRCIWKADERMSAAVNRSLYQEHKYEIEGVEHIDKYYLVRDDLTDQVCLSETDPATNNKGWRNGYQVQNGLPTNSYLNWREGIGYTIESFYMYYASGFKVSSSSSSSSRITPYQRITLDYFLRGGTPYAVELLNDFYCEAGGISEEQSLTATAMISDLPYSIVVPNIVTDDGNGNLTESPSPFEISTSVAGPYSKRIDNLYGTTNTIYVRMNAKIDNEHDFARGWYNANIYIQFADLLTTRRSVLVQGYIGGFLDSDPEALYDLGYAEGWYGRQFPQSFQLKGSSLVPSVGGVQNKVYITTTGVSEVCLTEDGDYVDAMEISIPEDGSFESTLWVKLKAGLEAGDKLGHVTATYSVEEAGNTLTLTRKVDVYGTVQSTLIMINPNETDDLLELDYVETFDPVVRPIHVAAYNLGKTMTVATENNRFQLALSADGPFQTDPLVLQSDDENLVESVVYVRLEPELLYSQNTGNLVLTAGGETKRVPVAGEITRRTSGIYDNTVIINSLEDHTWTYYKGVDHELDNNNYNTYYRGKLYSPQPRNVEVIYRGGGVENASSVAISGKAGEDQNEMVCFLTLECSDPNAVQSTTGPYPYRVISNPFSKRPKLGGKYYGFAGWKIVSGGEFIRGHANNEVLALDESLILENLSWQANHSLAARIVFEATWVEADVRVQSTMPTFTSGTYETNFWVLNNDIRTNTLPEPGHNDNTGPLCDLNQNMTITMKYPDGSDVVVGGNPVYGNKFILGHEGGAPEFGCTQGSGDGTDKWGSINKAISVKTDFTGTVKLEWLSMDLDDSNFISGGGRNLYLGRGITNEKRAGAPEVEKAKRCLVEGSCDFADVDQYLRIESGTYSHFRHFAMDMKVESDKKKIKQRVVFGCDYDMAKNDNSKLEFTHNMKMADEKNTFMYHSQPNHHPTTIDLGRASTDTVSMIWSKSGSFMTQVPLGQGLGDESYYLFVASKDNNGFRYLEIQGGEWGNIAGGMCAYNSETVPTFTLRMKGGLVRGCIHGAATRGTSAGIVTYVITGGNIKGWVAPGANGTEDGDASNPQKGVLKGTTYVYVGGNAHLEPTEADPIINRSVGGNVFGAGCGFKVNSNAGVVTKGTNVVLADNAYVHRGVYGGGSLGYTEGAATLYITGGFVAGNRGGVIVNDDGTPSYSNDIQGGVYGGARRNRAKDVSIFMTGGRVDNGLFGGSNSAGELTGNVNIKIVGGQIGASYAAGNVYGGGRGEQTTITGNVNVLVAGDAKVFDNVYGGSAEGVVDGNVTVNFGLAPDDQAEVSYLFGAGFGSSSDVSNNVTLNVNGGTVHGNIYGGGENGTVNRDDVDSDNKNVTVNINDGYLQNYVHGGGVRGACWTNTTVNVRGGTILGSVYAGAQGVGTNSILVLGTCTLNMMGGDVYGSVYGGSRNCSVGHIIWTNQTGYEPTQYSDRYTSFVNISGGRVRRQVYGGGFYGVIYGSTAVHIGKEAIVRAPDKDLNFNKPEEIDICPLRIDGSVYAGSNWGTFDEGQGFVNNTTSGYAHIYIDGTGYDNTLENGVFNGNFINIAMGIYGCGTSNFSGKMGNDIRIRNYGLPVKRTTQRSFEYIDNDDQEHTATYTYEELVGATREIYSIQQCDSLILENSHINLLGEGDKTVTNNTILFGLYGIGVPRVGISHETGEEITLSGGVLLGGTEANTGSSLIFNSRVEELHALKSVKIDGFYENPHYTLVNLVEPAITDPVEPENDIYSTFQHGIENTLRLNSGYSMKVRYANGRNYQYGELGGFFRMVVSETYNSFAFARPKLTKGNTDVENNGWDNENMGDGGFLCYHDRKLEHHNFYTDFGVEDTRLHQYQYYNSVKAKPGTKEDRDDFRVWRFSVIDESNSTMLPIALTAQPFDDPLSTIVGDFSQTMGYVYLPPYIGDSDNTRIEVDRVDFGDQVTLIDAALYHFTDPNSITYLWYDKETENHEIIPRAEAQANPTFLAEPRYATAHPNTSFGLAINAENNNISEDHRFIISPNSLSANQKPSFLCEKIAGEVPQLNFWLSYSQLISANTTLSPVTLFLHRFDNLMVDTDPSDRDFKEAREIVDEIIIPMTITTLTQLGKNMELNAYATYGETATNNECESFNVKCVLPTFAKPSDALGLQFVVKDVKFTFTGDCIGSSDVVSLIPHENPMPKTDCKFAMTVAQALNPDNTDGWMETISNFNPPVDAVNISSSTPYTVGWADGRSLATIDFTLYYNSFNDNTAITLPESGLVGDLEFTLGYYTDLADEGKTFTVTIHIYKKSKARKFYLDGEFGDDRYNEGNYPDKAKKTLQGIINQGYTTGDDIFVVNPVTVGKHNVLKWTNMGLGGEPVRLYRYSGNHELSTPAVLEPEAGVENYEALYAAWQKYENARLQNRNELVHVEGQFTMQGIILDGLSEWDGVEDPIFNPNENAITPIRPLVVVEKNLDDVAGCTFTVDSESQLRNNHNLSTSATEGRKLGGGIYIGPYSMIAVEGNSLITGNRVASGENGAGVYMDAIEGHAARLQAFGLLTITDNGIQDGENLIQNNVYMSDIDNFIQVDRTYGGSAAINANTAVGITKNAFYSDGDLKDFTPIVRGAFGDHIDAVFAHHNFFEDNRRYVPFHSDKEPFGEKNIYFGKTWAQIVTSEPTGFNASNIDSPEELAWAISLVNGLNGQTATPNTTFSVTADIDLSAHLWHPIGDSEAHAYRGSFNGNGHAIDGVYLGALNNLGTYGLFGYVGNGGIVQNTCVASGEISPMRQGEGLEYVGALAGVVKDGATVKFSEAVANLIIDDELLIVGGLVGQNQGTIHSSMAMPFVTGDDYKFGGLVGENAVSGKLQNAFSNVKFEGNNMQVGGLVAVNNGLVENCYPRFRSDWTSADVFGQFAGNNQGTIQYCYAPSEGQFVGEGSSPSGHGTYTATSTPYMYMHGDNDIILEDGQTNDYYTNATKATKWPIMLTTLNKWVEANGGDYAPWMRSSADGLNNDYPIHKLLGFNTVASSDGVGLDYKDNLHEAFAKYNALEGGGTLFLYGDDNSLVGAGNNYSNDDDVTLYIHEDAALLQNNNSVIQNAYVGFTMDNSGKNNGNYSTNGQLLSYDWHMVSSPLMEAPLGLNASNRSSTIGYGKPLTPGTDYYFKPESESDGYFPSNICPKNGSPLGEFDFYSFFEPHYHWINFKRSSSNHWHEDGAHQRITGFDNEPNMIKGKGYMIAIDSTTFMQSHGILCNGKVERNVSRTASNSSTPGKDLIGYNLVGNPYHAYLDFDALYGANSSKIENYYYIYDADMSGYVSYTYGTSKGAMAAERRLHPHQGFIVFVKSGSKIEFQETMCALRTEGSAFRKENIDYPLVNLWATDGKSGNEILVVEVNRPEWGGALKANGLRSGNCLMSASHDGEQYGILFAEEGCNEVPIRFKADADGTFTMHWNTANGQFIYLHLIDNIAGIDYDCLANESYTFEASANDYPSRFKLVFAVVSDDYDYNSEDSFAFFDGNDWIVGGQGYFQLVDMNGRVLYGRKLVNDVNRVQLPAVSSGMYLMQVMGKEGCKVQKVVVE